ncbi:MAG: serine hydrolase [Bacteroidetes bacterium]|nr:serine hydrolase [Bacteroidota bacterium]
MLMPFSYSELSTRTLGRMRIATQDFGVGGVILSNGRSADARALIDSLHVWSVVPPLIAADFENGPGMRIEDALLLPSMMALGATRNSDLVYRAGLATAAASRRIGVQVNFAPVADVNSNPRNPIINTRAFGETARLVGDMAEAYMRGLQDGGMIATAKHFPGHGDTHVDSHTGLPLLDASIGRLDSVELLPFRHLIDAGVAAVMSGHLAVPALTGDSSLPATLSPMIMDTLLRRRLGFGGLIFTDAMNMNALTRTGIGNLPAAAVRAGADILLIPGSLGQTIDSVIAAIDRGELDSMRVRRSVRRILEAKHLLRSKGNATDSADVDSDGVLATMVTRTDDSTISANEQRLARLIAEEAATLVRNNGALLPLADSSRILAISFVRRGEPAVAQAFAQRLRERFPRSRTLVIDRQPSRRALNALRDSLRGMDVIVLAAFISVVNASGTIGLSSAQMQVVRTTGEVALPRIFLSLGTPYVLEALPEADAMVCVYGDDPASIDASVRLIAGDIQPNGALPVTVPGIAAFGTGLRYPWAASDRITEAFRHVDSLILNQIARRATPGAQLAVVRGDSLVYRKSYGKLTYDTAATAVDDSTLYDLASLTKVVVTTTAVMRLVDAGRLHLDSTVAAYLPAFAAGGKEHVTIRNLLLHNSGLEAFRPFHEIQPDGIGVLDSIFGSRLVSVPGHRTVYSDFGMITMGKVIERITGRSLDDYAKEEILGPLGMRNSLFLPHDSLRGRAAPTEYDERWRQRLVQGSVHDETAALLGGVAGHAGLFSTATDLSRFVRMLLGDGTLEGYDCVQSATLTRFTTRQSLRKSRALGWDTKSASGSSAGRYFSMQSFGHTGFTGTSIWVDPVARIGVIFLTNRVHPTRENRALPRFRSVLHDAVREALMGQGDESGSRF